MYPVARTHGLTEARRKAARAGPATRHATARWGAASCCYDIISAVRALLFALLVSLAAVPSFAQSFGPEIPVAPGEPIEIRAGASRARVATDGHDYFAIWNDLRNGAPYVRGARFTAGGTLLDKDSIEFFIGLAGDVIWTGSAYFAAVITRDPSSAVIGTLVGREGTTRHTGTALALHRTVRPDSVALATNGSSILVATDRGQAALLNLDGTPRVAAIALGFDRCSVNGLGVAAAGENYLAVCATDRGVAMVSVTPAGSTLPVCCASVAHAAASADAASDGSTYFVPYAERHLLARRVPASDREPGPELRLDAAPLDFEGPVHSVRVAWRGSEYLVTYKRAYSLYALRVSAAGRPIGSPIRFGDSAFDEAAYVAARADGAGAIVWPTGDGGVRAGLFDPVSLAAAAPFHTELPIAVERRFQMDPVVAAAGDATVVAWAELGNLYLTRVGGAPILLDTLERAIRDYTVVYDGQHVWALWSAGIGRGIRARRFNTDLEPLDAAHFDIPGTSSSFTELQAVGGSGAVLVLWRESTGEPAAVVLRSGEEGAAVRRVHPLAMDRGAPAGAAWNGQNFVLAWMRGTSAIAAALVAPDGSVVAEPFIAVSGLTTTRFIIGSGAAFATLAWISAGETLALRLDGTTPSTIRRIAIPSGAGALTEIVPLANGDSYVVWSQRGRIDLQRVTADLAPLGPPTTFTANALPPGSPDGPVRWYSLDAAGTSLVIAYMRSDARKGASPRVYVRREAVRRRAVR